MNIVKLSKTILNMVRAKYIKTLSAIIFILSLSNVVNAADKFWIGPGILWSTGSNWSSGTIPGATDVAIFYGSFTGNCSLDAGVNVSGFDVRAGYIGTITQGAIDMQITSNAIFASGIFIGGTAKITIIGNLTILEASSFTSTAGILELQANYTLTFPATFTPNGGTIKTAGNGGTYTGNQTFYNWIIGGTSSPFTTTIAAGETFTVAGTLTIDATVGPAGFYKINGGTIAAQRDINFDSDLKRREIGTATLLINGGGAQTFTGYTADDYYFGMCKITIDNTGGTLTLVDNIATGADFTLEVTAGTVVADAGTSKVWFLMEGQTIDGDITLNDVVFNGIATASGQITIEASKTVIVTGTLTLNANVGATANYLINTGTIEAKGDINFNSDLTTKDSGTATILINGGGTQNFTGYAADDYFYGMPIININKATGDLKLFNNIATSGDFTYIQGSGIVVKGASKVWFLMEDQTVTGDIDLNDVVFNEAPGGLGKISIEASTTVTVNGTLTINSGGPWTYCEINGGTIAAKGDIIHKSTLRRVTTAVTGKLLITGTADQTFTGNADWTLPLPGYKIYYGLPDVEVDKAGGTLTFAGQINFPNNFKIAMSNMGNIDATSSTPIINYGGRSY